MTCQIINYIPDIKKLSYLELGMGNGKNFDLIRAHNKVSVDSVPLRGATASMTTDEFFEAIGSDAVWDIIFIDANHDLDFALRDFNHSILHCSRWVIMHDMIPPSERYTESRFCSDSYRLLYAMLNVKGLDAYPMVGNMGLTFIRMPAKKIHVTKKIRALEYADFMEFIKTQRLYTEQEMKAILCAS